VTEGQLQVAVPILAPPVPLCAARVRCPRHEATVRPEVPHRGEPVDVIDLEIDGEREDAPDARNPQQPLDQLLGSTVPNFLHNY
jgi:hypothetical protein